MTEEKKLICATCGGDLIPDKDKHLYKCTFCGVAYGYALFDGSAPQKAEKSMRIREFNDADLYYSFMLSSDPHNFLALRGRVMCAGKWTKLDEVKISKTITGKRAENVIKRCEDGLRNALEEDKPYFQLFIDLTNAIIEYYDNESQWKDELKSKERLKIREAGINSDIQKNKDLINLTNRGYESYSLIDMALNIGFDAICDKMADTNLQELREKSYDVETNIKESNHKLQPYFKKKEECEKKVRQIIPKIRNFEKYKQVVQ